MKTGNRANKKGRVMRGYREEQPSNAGKTLNKLPDKIPPKVKSSIPGGHGTGTKEGPAQELPKLLKKN